MSIGTTAEAAIRPQRATAAASRIAAIDILRGAVMALMAIDHVRVYSGVPAGGPSPAVFFTRWVTHFCAPAFVFLAGTSAYLYGRRHPALSRSLLVRGAWLVLLELTVIRIFWTFNLDFRNYMLAGVIWVIGWCMILLALLVRLRPAVIATVGLLIIAGHNVVDPYLPQIVPAMSESSLSWLWKILYLAFYAGPIEMSASGPRLIVLYTLIPWLGVMAAGYAFGKILTDEAARRRRLCFLIGGGAIVAFLVLRSINQYGDPRPWHSPPAESGAQPAMPAILSFLATTKYPASLDFLLMTLGPTIALLPWLENARGKLANGLALFGRVPFFYYLVHIPLIHVLAIGVSALREGRVDPWLFANHPMGAPPAPPGAIWNLTTLYAVWLVSLVLLYFPCRWFAGIKARRQDWWLRGL